MKYYNQKYDIDLHKMYENTNESKNQIKNINNQDKIGKTLKFSDKFSSLKKNIYNKVLTNQVKSLNSTNTINKLVPKEH